MQKFFMIIGKEKLNLYVLDGNHYKKQYIEGNPDFSYDRNRVENDIQKLYGFLVNEYNLSTEAELEFTVIDNEDKICSDVVERVLNGHMTKKITVEEVIKNVCEKLSLDKNLMSNEFGINFDGINYKVISDKVKKDDFCLLGYTIKQDDLIKFLE